MKPLLLGALLLFSQEDFTLAAGYLRDAIGKEK
jgi:hypothetical protein